MKLFSSKIYQSFILFTFTFLLSMVSHALSPELLSQLKQENIVDTTQTLSLDEIKDLKQQNEQLYQKDKIDIKILMIETTYEQSIEQYAYDIFNTLKIGTKDIDNGLLIVVAKDDHKMRIEVGRGLEGEITDLMAGRIIRNVMAPAFKDNLFYIGLSRAQQQLALQIKKPISDADIRKIEEQEKVALREPISVFYYLVFMYWVACITIGLKINFGPLFSDHSGNDHGKLLAIIYILAFYLLQTLPFMGWMDIPWVHLISLTMIMSPITLLVYARLSNRYRLEDFENNVLQKIGLPLVIITLLGVFVTFFHIAFGISLLSIIFAPLIAAFFSLLTAAFCSLLGRPDIYPPLPESEDGSNDDGSGSGSSRSSNHRSAGRSSSSSSSGGGRSSGGGSSGGGASGSW